MKFGTVLPGRYTGADRYAGVAVGRRSTVYLLSAMCSHAGQFLGLFSNTLHLKFSGFSGIYQEGATAISQVVFFHVVNVIMPF